MADIQIRLLGEPEVLWHGKPVTIERRITRYLLYYLASHDRLVNRARLLGLFWGEKDEKSARANLRQSLHRLRTVFTGARLLNEQEDLVGINYDEVEVDLQKFIHDFDLVFPIVNRLSPLRPLEAGIVNKLMALDGLWHGTLFLGESEPLAIPKFEEWFINTQDRFRHRRRWLLERLSDHFLAEGDLQVAINYAGRVLDGNETEENLHKRLITILLRMNRFGEARQYYKKALKKFANEGVHLSSEFLQEFDFLTNPVTRPQISTRTNPIQDYGIELPFVGRLSELDILYQQYNTGGVVFISGESGLGKTRLLEVFMNRVQPAPRVIYARARPGESGLPYQPLVDALRQGVQALEWLHLPGIYASHLSLLMPEVIVNRPKIKIPSIVSHEQARLLFQEALRQLLLLIAEKQHLVFVLDDAHWADEATCSALEYLVSRPPFGKHALMIISARVEEVNPFITRMQNNLAREPAVKTIQLCQLRNNEIAQLINSSLHIPVSPAMVEQVARDSGGNPLYIGEILASMAGMDVKLLESGSIPTSETLARLIKARLSALSKPTRYVLEAAAVLGHDFSLADLSGTTQYPPEELSSALKELDECHLLRINNAQSEFGKVRLQFIHDKFREVQLQMISPALLPSLHRQAAIAIQTGAGDKLDESALVIAQHYEQAGDFLQAFHMWVRAANHSLRLCSINEADLAFQRAAALIPHCNQQVDDEAILMMFDTWGEMWSDRNQTEILLKLGRQLISLGQARQSNLLACGAHHRLGNAAFTANDIQTGLLETSQAIVYLHELHYPRLSLRVYYQLGVLQLMAGNIQAGEESLKRALEYVDGPETGDPLTITWIGGIYYELGMIKTLSGWPSQGNEYGHQALAYLLKAQSKDMSFVNQYITLAGALIGMTDHYMGRFKEAAKQLQESIEPAIQARLWRAVGYLHDYIAMNELAMGNLDQMLAHAEQAIEIGEQINRKEIHSAARQVMGEALLRLQDFESAQHYLNLALEQNQDTFLTPNLMLRLGLSKIILGDLEGGYQLAIIAEKISQANGLGLIEAEVNIPMLFYYARSENWEECRERATRCIIQCRERKIGTTQIFGEFFLGLSLVQTREPERGLSMIQQVAQAAQSRGDFLAEVVARLSIMLLLKKAGQEASDELERITVLMKHLEEHTQSEFFRERFHRLITSIFNEPGIPGLIPTF